MSLSMDSPHSPTRGKASEPSLPPVAGVKRPAPTLLPPFEPLSSSPGLPRLVKKARGNASGSNFQTGHNKYPTPVPTSSTGVLSSSPPGRVGVRPPLQQTLSVSERMPLGSVPFVELNENGETLLMGRSSNSSHYQLSSNRLISRVHIKARYLPAMQPLQPNRVEIVCCGWNGLTLHCQGRTWDLRKGDTFTGETENTEIMIDVQDARVRIQWPRKDRSDLLGGLSDSSWDSPRSTKAGKHGGSASAVPKAPGASGLLSSPLRRAARIASPESPTPVGVPVSGTSLEALLSEHLASDEDGDGSAPIKIYEDATADELNLPDQTSKGNEGTSFATEMVESFSSDLSELQSDGEGDEHEGSKDNEDDDDPDEENDPIIHSFGPFGANLSNRLASFSTNSPKVGRPPLSRIPSADGSITSTDSAGAVRDTIHASTSNLNRAQMPHVPDKGAPAAEGVGLGISVAAEESAVDISSSVDVETVRNHLINQLAFSRLSSSPLSTILNNLPLEERRGLTRNGLRLIIEETTCVGVIPRQGKDAAGKPLESEYYYISDRDVDMSRRAAVDGLRKPSLRNCRKQHKQYYWKKPRTP